MSGSVLGWARGGVHRRGPVGIGKPGAGLLEGFDLLKSPLATMRNEQVDLWRAVSAGASRQETVVRSSGRFLTPQGW